MGRFLGKCEGDDHELGEITFKPRARAALSTSMAANKVRKTTRSCSIHQNWRLETAADDVAVAAASGSDSGASCCSSNSNVKEIMEVEGGEASSRQSHWSGEARMSESKPEAEKLDSPVNSGEAKSMNTKMKMKMKTKMPSDSEIDAFFSAAEKDLQKSFADKYNFDVVKDVPLEGRYEWVPIKP